MAASLPTRWARSSAASDWDTHGRRFFVARAVAVAPIWQPHRRRSSASLAGVGVRPAVAGRLGALGGTMGTPLDTPARRPPGVAGGVRPPSPPPAPCVVPLRPWRSRGVACRALSPPLRGGDGDVQRWPRGAAAG